MDSVKISRMLGLAIKAGAVIYGIDNIKKSKLKNDSLILLCRSAAEKLQKEAEYLEKISKVKLLKLDGFTIDELLNTNNCKVLLINNKTMAERILELGRS